ncbi:MAG: DNA-binding response regulator [Anaerolineales bacterium]|nr:MAG: DNA-binding response regulator [Anaerolineales bacterium]
MRLLLVEDNARLRNTIRLSLEEASYVVDSAADGAEGQELAELTPYDAIILDIMLPELDGLEVCRNLRKMRLRTPILMLTARDTVDDRVKGLDSGADDYLVKPFSMDELQARLRAVMRRDAPDKMGVLSAADLEVDPAAHTAQRAGVPIELTGKEFALLEYMIRNPNWLITREMAERHVWDYGRASGSNLVDVYIRRLRRKVDDPFEIKLIETVRGYGYRLNKPEA